MKEEEYLEIASSLKAAEEMYQRPHCRFANTGKGDKLTTIDET